ncbi:mannose-binding lectin [Coleofasciculus sp. F4-SAH-05]|uniref:mannose-binding lectin n=1 Tax=Coleofasciculus sp. F4-SAH-05 TaxID=3069525 RepID=UPI0032F14E39
MKKLFSIFRLTVVSLLATACFFGGFTKAAWALGDFSQSCYGANVSGSTLSAVCRTMSGSYKDTSIELNPVIENVDGQLTWQPSNFIQTCRYTSLVTPSLMFAECKTRDQRWVATDIDLDQHIANIDGTLKYE